MTPDQWQRIEEIFGAARELEPEQRVDYVKTRCQAESELFQHVIALLSQDEQAGNFMEEPMSLSTPTGDAYVHGQLIEKIGPYCIEKVLGQGGMGTVFLGRRQEADFEQLAAIKVLRAGWFDPDSLSRFKRETRILAKLRHPYVAQFMDAGVTDDSCPYHTMEYVEGSRIDDYCDDHRLDISNRIALFCRVCEAVEFAHHNLIVHRDIKPSNILVTESGVPKLLDFGIAKLLDTSQGTLAQPQETQTSLMSWPYAAPEQILSESISTATDQYSLGVLLFQLLLGSRPFQCSDIAAHIRAISETHAPLLSERLRDLEKTDTKRDQPSELKKHIKNRQTTTKKLATLFRRDLDWILHKALDRHPGNRYGSVAQFSSDLQRFLKGYPIQARRRTRFYTFQRFVSRNPLAVFGSAAFVITVLTFSLVTAFQSYRIQEQAEEIKEEIVRANSVSDFLVNLFEGNNPYKKDNLEISGRELLERGKSRIEKDLQDQPAIKAQMMNVLGGVYKKLGALEEAAELKRKALDLLITLEGPSFHIVAEINVELGTILKELDQFEEAERALSNALEIQRAIGEKENSFGLATTLDAYARLRMEKDRLDEALAFAREANQLWLSAGDRTPLESLARNHDQQALIYKKLGHYDQAESHYLEAIDIKGRLPEDADINLASSLNNLGNMYFNMTRYQEAEEFVGRAFRIWKSVLGGTHPTVATGHHNLANILTQLGRFQEAENHFKTALALRTEALGDKNSLVIGTRHGLATLYFKQGHFEKSAREFSDALTAWKSVYGDRHINVLRCMSNLGSVLIELQEIDRAEKVLSEALEIGISMRGNDNVHNVRLMDKLANIARLKGKLDTAEDLYSRSLEIKKANFKPDNANMIASYSGLAAVKMDAQRYEEAKEFLKSSLEICNQQLPEVHPTTVGIRLQYAMAVASCGNSDEGIGIAQDVIEKLRRTHGERSAQVADASRTLAEIFIEFDRDDEAKGILLDGMAILTKEKGPDHPMTRRTKEVISRLQLTNPTD